MQYEPESLQVQHALLKEMHVTSAIIFEATLYEIEIICLTSFFFFTYKDHKLMKQEATKPVPSVT
jgi:hypothetical protein